MSQKDIPASIDYPCRWIYKVIGTDEAMMRAAIARIVTGHCEVTISRSSATGKYLTLNVAVHVQDERSRIHIYEALSKEPSVKIVL